jgi:hypothetical protein
MRAFPRRSKRSAINGKGYEFAGDVVEATVVNAKAKVSIGFLYKEAGRAQGRVGRANLTESESIHKVLLDGIGFSRGKRVYLSR